MGIEEAVSRIDGIEEFPGLDRAWRWSPTPSFVFSLALDEEGDRLYQVNTLDSFNEELVREVLLFSRNHPMDPSGSGEAVTVTPGFSCEGYRFDVIAAVPSAVHGYYAGRDERLNEAVTAVFPAYRCEFSGSESIKEIMYRFHRMLRASTMTRPPVPFLRMKHENSKTGGGSVGSSRGFTTPDVLLNELKLLEGAPGSFVEYENFQGDIWRIEWDGSWVVNGISRHDPLSDEWVMSSLGCPPVR
ncbi:hypothetical protein [Streptomyces sp. MA15]|uniref:hypothetical protein n=1 Tax=Streptomyces sp. MA15 TaxID=3055061 RepID=UPI0025B12A4A|nr:hypothetical protein [Streptomyces sp. MA15]MDN3272531.1 hypothetical protein [Streptomyces sp. MA15]